MSDFLNSLAQNAASSGVGSLINLGVGEISANLALNRQRKLMRESDAYQRRLISDLPSLNKAAMQSAGLSTSMLNGAFQNAATNAASTSPAAPAASGSYDPSFATSLLSNKNLRKQNDLLDKQIKSADEDVKAKQYNNKVLKAQTEDTLKTMSLRGFRTRVNHETPPKDGDVVVSAPAVDDYMSLERKRLIDGLEDDNFNADRRESVLRGNKAFFDNEILSSQIMDKDVMYSLVHAPYQAYIQVVENVRKLRNDNDFFENVKKYREEVEKFGPRAAYLGLINSLTDIQGKQLANTLNYLLMPYTLQNTRTETENKTNESNNNPTNILERFLNGKGSWKDAVRVGLPIVNSLFKSFGPGAFNPDALKSVVGFLK